MTLLHALLSAAAFGILGVVLMIVGFLLFDSCLRRVDLQKELAEHKSLPAAIVTAALLLGIAWIVIHAMT